MALNEDENLHNWKNKLSLIAMQQSERNAYVEDVCKKQPKIENHRVR